VIVVQANLAGASPDTMASTVAEPLERRLATIADVNELTSTSYVGSTMVVVVFGLNRDINGAARDVEAAIQAARADLPTTLRSNPTYRQYNPASAPVMVLALTSDTLTKAQLYDSADSVIQQQLSQVDGVGQITLGGGALPSVRVELQPGKLNSYGIGLEDVRAAVSAANADSAKGHIDQNGQRFEVLSNDQISTAAPYRDLVIAYRAGAPVFLRDVAGVIDSNENIRNAGLYNGKSAVLVIVYPLPGSNIVKTVGQIEARLPIIQAALPKAIHVNVAVDRSESVRASTADTERTLFLAVLLVIGVVFVFLLSPRATLIPAVALLQHRQPVADGAHHRHRLRRRRRGGGAGEHRAPCRSRARPEGSRAARCRRSRLHGGLDEPVADRRVPAHSVDAGHRRPAVSRVRRHAVDCDPAVARDLAHRHADHVRVRAAPRARGAPAVAHRALGRRAVHAVPGRV
jgi:multidrug efflux pump